MKRRAWLWLLPAFLLLAAVLSSGSPQEAQAQSTPPANADGSYTIPQNWPLNPAGLNPGDKFRLLVVTSDTHQAFHTDIAQYNLLVRNSVKKSSAHTSIQPYSFAFKVVGCTSGTNARQNTDSESGDLDAPIFWMNGHKLADNYADFYDGTWQGDRERTSARDERGQTPASPQWPWTGCNSDGTAHADELGNDPNVRRGASHSSSNEDPLSQMSASRTIEYSLYGLSPVFLVGNFDQDTTMVPFNWPLKPAGLNPGDKFRLLFVTSGTHLATSTSIDTYNRFIQEQSPAHQDIRSRLAHFKVVGSTRSVPARNNTEMRSGNNWADGSTSANSSGTPIYWLNGEKVADNYYDFYDGSWDNRRNPKDQNGQASTGSEVWTGTNDDGTSSNSPLGTSDRAIHEVRRVTRGFNGNSGSPINNGATKTTNASNVDIGGQYYGISLEFTVGPQVGVTIDESGGNTTVAENGGTDTYTVVLYGAPTHDVTITVSITTATRGPATVNKQGGTAGHTQTLTFTPVNWETPQTITVAGVDDNIDNPGNSRSATIRHTVSSTDTNYNNLFGSDLTVTVNDNDAAPSVIDLSVSDDAVAEGDGAQTITVTATVQGSTRFGTVKTVAVAVSGSGGSNVVDFTASPSTFNIAITAGERTGTGSFTLTPTDDSVAESNEEVTVSGTLSGVTVGSALITLADDDTGTFPVLTISGGNAVNEGGGAEFTITANPPVTSTTGITLNYTVSQSGDFVAPADLGSKTRTFRGQSATYSVSTQNDNTDESNGSVTIELSDGTGYTVGSSSSATVTVRDDDGVATPEANFASASSSVTENVGTHNVAIALDPAPTTAIAVTYIVTGTATVADGDYTIAGLTGGLGTANVGIGATRVNIPIAITDDNTQENDETIIVTLRNPGPSVGYTRGTDNVHTVTIQANDGGTTTQPRLTISGGSPITEGGSATFTISASPAPSGSIDVRYAVTQSGNFVQQSLLGAKSLSLSGTSETITVATQDDNIGESNGSVEVTLTGGTGYSVGSPSSATVTVRDNDATTPPVIVEPERLPGAPQNLTLTAGDQQIAASWNPPDDLGNPALDGYTVERREANSGDWTAITVTDTTATITGLTNEQSYQVRVAATNSDGTGPYAGPESATPSATATPPTDTCGETITADGLVSGTWAAGCQSQVTDRGYARYYTFTLAQQSAVTIDLESSVDPYLYLRSGNARTGSFLYENDDVEPRSDTDSQISQTLTAGTYTIEATTYATDQAGTFTLTVSGLGGTATPTPTPPPTDSCGETITGDGSVSGTWAAGCQSQVTDRGYARYYTFTLSQQSAVTIDLESSIDTYLYLRRGTARSGAALHLNDDLESGNLNSRISETLAAGDYTIEATTYADDQAGTFTLTVSGLGGTATDSCGETLTADGTESGQWVAGCESAIPAPGPGSGARLARYYTFTLSQQSAVTIDLESSIDTYLYLRSGTARSGAALHLNDDLESGNLNSRISETLAAGDYTIEATTYAAAQPGTFTLTVSGLGGG